MLEKVLAIFQRTDFLICKFPSRWRLLPWNLSEPAPRGVGALSEAQVIAIVMMAGTVAGSRSACTRNLAVDHLDAPTGKRQVHNNWEIQ
jgi:hypothetical protein